MYQILTVNPYDSLTRSIHLFLLYKTQVIYVTVAGITYISVWNRKGK